MEIQEEIVVQVAYEAWLGGEDNLGDCCSGELVQGIFHDSETHCCRGRRGRHDESGCCNLDVVIWMFWFGCWNLLLKRSCQHETIMSAQMAMYLVIIPFDWITNLRTTRDNRTERRFEEKLKIEVMNRSGCPIRGRWDLRFAD